jgi:hypothetical protein
MAGHIKQAITHALHIKIKKPVEHSTGGHQQSF